MFAAPAGGLDEGRMMLAKSRLEERGYRIKVRDDLFASEGYLGGSDERRAEELMEGFLDAEVRAIFPGRGGYGTMRILDRLDYRKIRRNAKVVVGFSDITGLHLALNRKARIVTYHTPSPMYGLGGEEGLSGFSERYFYQAIERPDDVQSQGYEIEIMEDVPDPVCLGKGTAQGRLMGGNLSMLSALEGTPYGVMARNAILLIEDTREAPYRIDRMLRQLLLAGKLQRFRGAVLGQFTRNYLREDQEAEDPRFSVEGVLRQYFEPLQIPVIMNFPIGHHKMNASLPLGGEVAIDADRCVLRVLKNS
jgi:muramoyltetrapeptide carboxypeptidase